MFPHNKLWELFEAPLLYTIVFSIIQWCFEVLLSSVLTTLKGSDHSSCIIGPEGWSRRQSKAETGYSSSRRNRGVPCCISNIPISGESTQKIGSLVQVRPNESSSCTAWHGKDVSHSSAWQVILTEIWISGQHSSSSICSCIYPFYCKANHEQFLNTYSVLLYFCSYGFCYLDMLFFPPWNLSNCCYPHSPSLWILLWVCYSS